MEEGPPSGKLLDPNNLAQGIAEAYSGIKDDVEMEAFKNELSAVPTEFQSSLDQAFGEQRGVAQKQIERNNTAIDQLKAKIDLCTPDCPAAVLPAELKRQQEELEKQNEELICSLQRLQADFDNYRKRVEREKTEIKYCTKAELMAKLLPVLDSFELALKNSSDKSNHQPSRRTLLLRIRVPAIRMDLTRCFRVLCKNFLEVSRRRGIRRRNRKEHVLRRSFVPATRCTHAIISVWIRPYSIANTDV